jgi:hypothetical protein
MVSMMDNRLKPIRGAARLPIVVDTTSNAAEILSKGVQKLSAHDQHFSENNPSPHILMYPDGTLVEKLPEGGDFTLEAYKKEVGKEYGRITLYVLSKECLGKLLCTLETYMIFSKCILHMTLSATSLSIVL